MQTIKEMTIKELVSEAVRLDRELKENKRGLDDVKAELQARGLKDIEDRNIKFVRYYAEDGSVSVLDAQSMDVINVDRLKEVLSEGVWKSKVTEETKTTYKYDKNLEKMLKAAFTGDYSFETSLEDFLDTMQDKPDGKQKKLLLKKLKGEYTADRKTLISVFGHGEEETGYFDVELWHIYKIKNGELIKSFLGSEQIEKAIAGIRNCLIVDSKTGITVDYDKEDK